MYTPGPIRVILNWFRIFVNFFNIIPHKHSSWWNPAFLLHVKWTVAWDFWTLFFPQIGSTQSPDSHPKVFSSFDVISLSYWPYKKKSMCIKHGSFWISMFQYTDIFESQWKTLRFKNFFVLNMEIFEYSCIETGILENMNSFALQNLCVHYTKIFESPCIEIRRFKNLHV